MKAHVARLTHEGIRQIGYYASKAIRDLSYTYVSE